MVHTPPSVSSSTASTPPQLPYHHHPPTSPIRPVPKRRAVTVTVKTARSNDQQNANCGYSSTTIIASPKSKSNTTLINLNDIPDTDGAFTTAATKRLCLPSMVKCICLGVCWEQPVQQCECFCCGIHS